MKLFNFLLFPLFFLASTIRADISELITNFGALKTALEILSNSLKPRSPHVEPTQPIQTSGQVAVIPYATGGRSGEFFNELINILKNSNTSINFTTESNDYDKSGNTGIMLLMAADRWQTVTSWDYLNKWFALFANPIVIVYQINPNQKTNVQSLAADMKNYLQNKYEWAKTKKFNLFFFRYDYDENTKNWGIPTTKDHQAEITKLVNLFKPK